GRRGRSGRASPLRLEVPGRLVAVDGGDQVLGDELLAALPAARTDTRDRALDVDRRLTERRLPVDDERPVGSDLAFVRHADRTGVDDTQLTDTAVELMMRVADDERPTLAEHGAELVVRREH